MARADRLGDGGRGVALVKTNAGVWAIAVAPRGKDTLIGDNRSSECTRTATGHFRCLEAAGCWSTLSWAIELNLLHVTLTGWLTLLYSFTPR